MFLLWFTSWPHLKWCIGCRHSFRIEINLFNNNFNFLRCDQAHTILTSWFPSPGLSLIWSTCAAACFLSEMQCLHTLKRTRMLMLYGSCKWQFLFFLSLNSSQKGGYCSQTQPATEVTAKSQRSEKKKKKKAIEVTSGTVRNVVVSEVLHCWWNLLGEEIKAMFWARTLKSYA